MKAVMRILLMTTLPVTVHAQEPRLFDAAGYRAAQHRGPVHRAPEGVGRIAPVALAGLRPDVDAIFVDVLPAEGGYRQDDGRWRLARAHSTIPGAYWFPEAGRAAPPAAILFAFQRRIAQLSGGDKSRMIVTFCLADCWMSWNAARRLRALGYRNVWWLAEGTDGWRDLGLTLKPVDPER